MIVLQMSFVNVFADVSDVETYIWSDIATLGMTLDSTDFLDTFYAVEEDQIPNILGLQSTPDSGKMKTRSFSAASPKGRREREQ